MDAAICLPFLHPPLPNQAHIPTGVNTMTAVGIFPKYGRLCICDAQSKSKRQKIRLGCKLPKWDFRHILFTKVTVPDPLSLVYSITEPW